MTFCYEVFQENTVGKRRAFFTDPLMSYLWKMFIDFKPSVVNDYLETIRSNSDDGENRYKTLLSDIKKSEKQYGVKILPDGTEVSFEGANPFITRD